MFSASEVAASLIELAGCQSPACAPPPAGTGGSLPGGGRSVTVEAKQFLKDNPQQPGENFFAWQGRIVQGLDPQLQSDVLFAGRETYEPCDNVVEGMNKWCDMKGLPRVNPDCVNIPVDIKAADEAARIFETTPDQTGNAEVEAAYADFKSQNEEMYDFMTRPESEGGMGIKVSFTKEGDPYPTAADQARDIRENRHVVIESGLGGDHTKLTTDEYDRFRAIHDVFGHAGIGGGFDRHGEYQAWLVHSAMYTGGGQRAMSTEYRAVNSAMWTGEPGTPGAGKAILLPERLTKPPPGAVIAAATRNHRADVIVEALKIDAEFTRKFDHLPLHARRGTVASMTGPEAIIAACYSRACAPPPAGSGGSKPGGGDAYIARTLGMDRKPEAPLKGKFKLPKARDRHRPQPKMKLDTRDYVEKLGGAPRTKPKPKPKPKPKLTEQLAKDNPGRSETEVLPDGSRVYYHGSGREGDRISTVFGAEWDDNYFVSHDATVAELYGPNVDRVVVAPGAKVKVIDRAAGQTVEKLAEAKAEGYDVVEFYGPHDAVGHIVLNRDVIADGRRQPPPEERRTLRPLTAVRRTPGPPVR